MFERCWFTNYVTPYQASDYIISETANIHVEDYSVFIGSHVNAANGGARNIIPQTNDIEKEADRGGRHGTLDAPDLTNAAFSS